MNYVRFLIFDIIGGIAWVSMFILVGYYFGNISAVKENFSLVILGIVFISLIPIVYEIVRSRTGK